MLKKIFIVSLIAVFHSSYTMESRMVDLNKLPSQMSQGTTTQLLFFEDHRIPTLPTNQTKPLQNNVHDYNPKQWLCHFGVSCLVYNGINFLSNYMIKEIVSNVEKTNLHSRYLKSLQVALQAFSYFGAYKLNNTLYQKISPERYEFAHFLGLLTSLRPK